MTVVFVLVMYDVPARRTERFRKLLGRYLDHQQYSVFAGDLPPAKLTALRAEIDGLLRPEDRVVEVTAANRHNVTVMHVAREGRRGPVKRRPCPSHARDHGVL